MRCNPAKAHKYLLFGVLFWCATILIVGYPRAHATSPTSQPSRDLATPSPRLPLSFIPNKGQFGDDTKFYLQDGRRSLRIGVGEVTLSTPDLATGRGSSSTVRIQFLDSNPQVTPEGRDRLPGIANFYYGSDPSRWVAGIPTFASVAQHDLYPGITQIYRGAEGRVKSEFRVAPQADPGLIRMRYSGAESLTLDDNGELVVTTRSGEWRESAPVVYQMAGSRLLEIASSFRLLGPMQVGFALGAYDPSLELVIDPTLFFSTYLGGMETDNGGGIAVDAWGNVLVIGTTTSTDFPVQNAAYSASSGEEEIFVAKLNPNGDSLVYSTYLGGTERELGIDIAADPQGNAYGVGWTASSGFPTTSGAYDETFSNAADDAAVFKLSPTGVLIYSTFLGGNGDDQPQDIAVDDQGQAFVIGGTSSTSFPTTPGVYSSTLAGSWDIFATKINAAGSGLLYSTLIGGMGYDEPKGLAIDAQGSAYITGRTQSGDYPIVGDPVGTPVYDSIYNGTDTAFLTKLNSTGTDLVYSTFLDGISPRAGSSKLDVAVDASYHAYVTAPSEDNSSFPPTMSPFDPTPNGPLGAVVMKVEPDGSGLVYSTYLGGSGEDRPNAIAVDASGSAHIAGSTTSADFPLADPLSSSLNGPRDVFVSRLDPDGSQLPFSSYLGGSDNDTANGLALGRRGPCLTGFTASMDFPTGAPSPGFPFETDYAGGTSDAFVTCVDTDCLTPPLDMVFWAPFDEQFGPTAADLVAGNNGTHLDFALPAGGKVGRSINLVDGYVEVAPAPELDFGVGSFSVDFWIENEVFPPMGGIVAKFDTATDRGFEIFWDSASLFITLNGFTHALTGFVVGNGNALPWTHIVIVVDRDEALIRFFVDGTLRAGVPLMIPLSANIDNGEPMLIGKGVSVPSDFSGRLDELELFDRALEDVEIEDLYAAGSQGKCKDSLHVPWDTRLCRGQQEARVDIEVCNYSTTPQSYELTFAPLPIGSGCTIPGPTQFSGLPSGAPPLPSGPVPAQSCVQVPVKIGRPAQMVASGDIGCFQVTRRNLSTGSTQISAGSLEDTRTVCSVPTPLPDSFQPALGRNVFVVPVGSTLPISFEVSNTTASNLTYNYRIEAFAADMENSFQDVIGLDGNSPGVPATGSRLVEPGEIIDISADVDNLGSDAFSFYDVVLTAETSGIFVPISSIGIRRCLPTEIVVANLDLASTAVNSPVVIPVAANDFSLAGPLDLSSLQLLSGPFNGAATANPSGTFTYQPNLGFRGADAFSYEICESGGNCHESVVGIWVREPKVLIFADSFESGSASAWKVVSP